MQQSSGFPASGFPTDFTNDVTQRRTCGPNRDSGPNRDRCHPHMLRHACGFALANAGHDTRALRAYLGHRNIQCTVRYTELAPDRFKDFRR